MAVLGAEGTYAQLKRFKVRALSVHIRRAVRVRCAARGKHVSPVGRAAYVYI